jgi:uncharacterized RDD family membrane protein YckC
MTKSLTTGSSAYEGKRWDYKFIPDIFEERDFFAGIRTKRVLAYVIDLFVMAIFYVIALAVGGVFTVMSFGLLGGPVVFILGIFPVIYHALFVASSMQGTPGMRMMGIKVHSWDGSPPNFLQAVLLSVMFYVSMAITILLVMIVPLLNARGRCLHDYLSGVFVVNDLEIFDAE